MPAAPEILIVEDSPTQTLMLVHLLEKHGYAVSAASNGREGLDRARRQPPALLISDVLMPEMDGYQLCQALKQDPALGAIPVILLTTLSEAGDVLRGLEASADYYISKPFDEAFLLAKVHELLVEPAAARAGAPAEPWEIVVAGQRHVVTANHRHVINLLLSTYENAVQQNRQLIRTQGSERAAHEALKRTQGQLVQTEKLASLGQMVAGIAHEVNNPLAFVLNNMAVMQRDLTAMVGLMQLYRQGDAILAAAQPDLHQQIQDEARRIDIDYTLTELNELVTRSREGLKRIEQIVRDLRDFARMDALEISAADINAGLKSTVNIIEPRARHKEVGITLQLAPLPPVMCFPAKINQVIMNLLSNAIDASPAGAQVLVRTAVQDDMVEISVADHGSGIDPAVCSRIFDPFFTTKPQGKGLGLGLSISYGIVRDHGGDIEVQSAPGRGATFTVRIPVHPPTGKASVA